MLLSRSGSRYPVRNLLHQAQRTQLVAAAQIRQFTDDRGCCGPKSPYIETSPSSCTQVPQLARTKDAQEKVQLNINYPAMYHAGLFPWLLSAERQRIPYDDVELQRAAACTNAALAPVPSLSSHPRGVDGVFLENAARCLPSPVRRYLAHLLNMHIAT
ncbi:hypothetical protein GQ54DRAFT_309356, partial [Martensiomyces pterosporus]